MKKSEKIAEITQRLEQLSEPLTTKDKDIELLLAVALPYHRDCCPKCKSAELKNYTNELIIRKRVYVEPARPMEGEFLGVPLPSHRKWKTEFVLYLCKCANKKCTKRLWYERVFVVNVGTPPEEVKQVAAT